MDKISIVIADDHPFVLNGIQSYVEQLEYPVEKTFDNGISCLNYIIMKNPDLAILDINMPGMSGVEIINEAKKVEVKTKFVILTLHKEESIYVDAMNKGANGYLLKENALNELGQCIRKVMEGKKYLGKGLFSKLITTDDETPEIIEQFTKTEQKIIRLIALNKSSKEIANILFLSKKTIDNQRNNISNKLGLNNTQTKLANWVETNRKEILKDNTI